MLPVSLSIKPDRSFNNWKCCFGCKCWKVTETEEEKQESPVSVKVVEVVTRTFERHHASNPQIVPMLPQSPTLTRNTPGELPPHLGSVSISSINELKKMESSK